MELMIEAMYVITLPNLSCKIFCTPPFFPDMREAPSYTWLNILEVLSPFFSSSVIIVLVRVWASPFSVVVMERSRSVTSQLSLTKRTIMEIFSIPVGSRVPSTLIVYHESATSRTISSVTRLLMFAMTSFWISWELYVALRGIVFITLLNSGSFRRVYSNNERKSPLPSSVRLSKASVLPLSGKWFTTRN